MANVTYNRDTVKVGQTLSVTLPAGGIFSLWQFRTSSSSAWRSLIAFNQTSFTVPATITQFNTTYDVDPGAQFRVEYFTVVNSQIVTHHSDNVVSVIGDAPILGVSGDISLPVAAFSGSANAGPLLSVEGDLSLPVSTFSGDTTLFILTYETLSYTLGTPSPGNSNRLDWSVKVPISVDLVEGTQQMAIRRLRIDRSGSSVNVFFNLQPWSGTDVITGGDMHDFLAEIEEDTEAFVIGDGDNSFTLPGPNSADATTKDATDRYQYVIGGDAATAILSFMTDHSGSLGATAFIRIRRRVLRLAGPQLFGTLSLPVATFSGAATIDVPPSVSLVGDISLPVATFSGSATLGFATLLEGKISLPVATFSGSATIDEPPTLSVQGDISLPVATFSGSATLVISLSLSGDISLPVSTFSGAATTSFIDPTLRFSPPSATLEFTVGPRTLVRLPAQRERIIVVKFENDPHGICSGDTNLTLPDNEKYGNLKGITYYPWIQIMTDTETSTLKASAVAAAVNALVPPDEAIQWAGRRESGEIVIAAYLERGDNQVDWSLTDHGFIGLLDDVDQEDISLHTFTFMPVLERVTKRDPTIWSHHAQQSRYPGDTTFNDLETLSTRGQYVKFP